MSNDPMADGARAAADRLSARNGARLTTDVEVALANRDTPPSRDQFFEPIALGSLIVSIAALTWTIYKDRKNQGANPPTEVIVRAVRIELDNAGRLDPEQHDPVIQATVEETLNAAKRDGAG
jgi:hypothetical protein